MVTKSFYLYILLAALFSGVQISSCADSGRRLASDESLDGEQYVDQENDSAARPGSILLYPDQLHQQFDQGESCRAAGSLDDPYMKAGIAADDYPFQVLIEGGIKVKIGRNEEGLWLGLEDESNDWNGRELEIRLTRVRLDEWAWLQVADVRTIKWRNSDIFASYPDGWQKF